MNGMSFHVSAPGTVFLYGNPAVGHEKSCVTAGLNMRTTLTFFSIYPYADETNIIEISFNSIRLHVKIPVHTYHKFFFSGDSRGISPFYPLYRAVNDYVNSLTKEIGNYDPRNREHQSSLQSFFYLLHSVVRENNLIVSSSCIVILSTDLPIGEGLGSSESFIVCLAACFWRFSLLQKNILREQFDTEDLIKIQDLAYNCDSDIYKSDKIKIVTSVRGSVAVFTETFLQNLISDIPSMKILLVFSNISQKVSSMEKLQRQTSRHLYPFARFIMNSIDAILETSTNLFNNIVERRRYIRQRAHTAPNRRFSDPTRQLDELALESYFKLSSLIRMNQGLLKALGMSHRNLDLICAIAEEFSFAGKLTGKGGAGYAFILLPPGITDGHIDLLTNVLKSHNFNAVLTNLCCSGLSIKPTTYS